MDQTRPVDPIYPVKQYSEGLSGEPGLTKREHFAALAMQALITGPASINRIYVLTPHDVARESLRHADALIELLNEGH